MLKKTAIVLFCSFLSAAVATGENRDGSNSDWEERVSVDPVTGVLRIDTSPSKPHERGNQPTTPPPSVPDKKKTEFKIEGREYMNQEGERILRISPDEAINMETGERYIDIGDGETQNVDTGERYLNIDKGEKINIDTGERVMDLQN